MGGCSAAVVAGRETLVAGRLTGPFVGLRPHASSVLLVLPWQTKVSARAANVKQPAIQNMETVPIKA